VTQGICFAQYPMIIVRSELGDLALTPHMFCTKNAYKEYPSKYHQDRSLQPSTQDWQDDGRKSIHLNTAYDQIRKGEILPSEISMKLNLKFRQNYIFSEHVLQNYGGQKYIEKIS
jgi:hypothetical protein